MTNQDLLDITILMDRSGSMHSIHEPMERGFAEFLAEQRKAPGKTTLTLIKFDDQYETAFSAVPIGEAPPMILQPRGNTALIDAMVQAIKETGDRLSAMPEDKRPGKVMFVTITDGEENSSVKHRLPELAAAIAHQRDNYNWQFVYLGANQDAFAVGSSLGVAGVGTHGYANTSGGVKHAYHMMNNAVRSTRTRGVADVNDPVTP